MMMISQIIAEISSSILLYEMFNLIVVGAGSWGCGQLISPAPTSAPVYKSDADDDKNDIGV